MRSSRKSRPRPFPLSAPPRLLASPPKCEGGASISAVEPGEEPNEPARPTALGGLSRAVAA